MIHYLVFNVFVVASFASEQKIVSPKSSENVGEIHPPEISDPLRGLNQSAAKILNFYKNASASSSLLQVLNANRNDFSDAADLTRTLIAEEEAQLNVLKQLFNLVSPPPRAYKLQRDFRLGTLSTLYKAFTITFDLYLNSFENSITRKEWGNVFAMFLDRKAIFDVMIHSAHTWLRIQQGAIGAGGYKVLSFPLRKWNNVLIQQVLVNGKYMNSIIINHKIVHTVQNRNPREFKNLEVYAAGPYGYPADGYMKHIRIRKHKP